MKPKPVKFPDSFTPALIAPCGMNCGVCIGFLRDKKPCSGCNGDDSNKPKHCIQCSIKLCAEMPPGEQQFCFECTRFPCARLRQLDKRYRTQYGMSMVENLTLVRQLGLDEFVAREKLRWACPQCGGIVCAHREACIYCGQARG